MTHTSSAWLFVHTLGRVVEHVLAVIVGMVMMIVGTALGISMIMLPVGIVMALAGVGLVVIGLFARVDERHA